MKVKKIAKKGKKLLKEASKLSKKKQLKLITKFFDKNILETLASVKMEIGVETSQEREIPNGIMPIIKMIATEFIGNEVKVWADSETIKGKTTHTLYFEAFLADEDEEEKNIYLISFPNGTELEVIEIGLPSELAEEIYHFCFDISAAISKAKAENENQESFEKESEVQNDESADKVDEIIDDEKENCHNEYEESNETDVLKNVNT